MCPNYFCEDFFANMFCPIIPIGVEWPLFPAFYADGFYAIFFCVIQLVDLIRDYFCHFPKIVRAD